MLMFGLTCFLATVSGPVKTVAIGIRNRNVDEVAHVLETLKSVRGQITVNASARTIRITDLSPEVDRMAGIVRAIDESEAPDQRIRMFHITLVPPSEFAKILDRILVDARPGLTLSKFVPADREEVLIVVGNYEAHKLILGLRPNGCPDGPRRRASPAVVP